MSSVLLGLAAALAWGLNDFLPRVPSRAVGPIPTVLVVTAAGLIVLSFWILLGGATIRIVWPSLWLVALSGVCFTLGTLSLYAALARGPIAIVAPIAGSFPALAMIIAIGSLYLCNSWRSEQALLPVRWLPLLALMGCLDVAALGTIVAGGNLPDPEFATVVSAAFSAITVLLARAFLKEPIAPAQLAGMALIFGGAAALAGL
jgi:uncharacterized membrane protein